MSVSARPAPAVLQLVVDTKSGKADTLIRDAFVRVGATVVAEATLRADRLVLRDLTGRGFWNRGARHRELQVQEGDSLVFEVPAAGGRWERARALVVRPVELQSPVVTEKPPICWRSFVTASGAGYRSLFELALAADSSAPLWIHGESGTGKELAAAAVHGAGPRSRGPFEALNCAALPAELVESELFGVERGAFTGAQRSRSGAFSRAHGGTLLLDEVGELPLAAQAKLLRVLESSEVRPVGADRAVKVDVRVVAASWRNLATEVEAGRFRHDLFHRLCVLRVGLPPLRERPDDIVPILAELLGPTRHERAPYDDPLWPDDVMFALLKAQAWPGNVRELRNGAYRAMATLDRNDLLSQQTLRLVEDKADDCLSLEFALALSRGNRTKAARTLGVSRSTFYRWMDRMAPARALSNTG